MMSCMRSYEQNRVEKMYRLAKIREKLFKDY